MMVSSAQNPFQLENIQAEYEKIAEEIFLEMSDGVKLRILRSNAIMNEETIYNVVIFPGWGSVVLGWDEVLMEMYKDFNLVYIESREKGSSIIHKKASTGMDRMSDDLKEVIEQLNLDESNLILFGSCFGATVIAHGLANQKYDPLLSVLIAPPARFDVPPMLRHIGPYLPAFFLNVLRPMVKLWIKKSKSESPEQAAKYIRVLNEADGRKWKKFGKPLALPYWWDVYANIKNRVLLIAAETDKMHDATITKEIKNLMPNAKYLDLGSNKNTHSLPVVEVLRNYLKELNKE
ncbi:MAG: alpha/beta fold hydrolase [Candidatus Heimdallarchaeaceae archaeon]